MHKFYLDTNALYSITKIGIEKIPEAFTSAFALFEIISNVKENNYQKRKAILNNIFNSQISIDWQFPQEIIFNSFDYFDDFEIIDVRMPHLEHMIDLILKSSSFEDLRKSNNEVEINLKYFEELDKGLAENFVNTSEYTIYELKNLMTDDRGQNRINFAGNNYDLSTYEGLRSFFSSEPQINNSITILAQAKLMKTMFPDYVKTESDLEIVYESYNNLISIYIEYFSAYCAQKYVDRELPSKNDFIDLAHLIYLRNDHSKLIVSNDKIFEKLGVNTIPVEALF